MVKICVYFYLSLMRRGGPLRRSMAGIAMALHTSCMLTTQVFVDEVFRKRSRGQLLKFDTYVTE